VYLCPPPVWAPPRAVGPLAWLNWRRLVLLPPPCYDAKYTQGVVGPVSAVCLQLALLKLAPGLASLNPGPGQQPWRGAIRACCPVLHKGPSRTPILTHLETQPPSRSPNIIPSSLSFRRIRVSRSPPLPSTRAAPPLRGVELKDVLYLSKYTSRMVIALLRDSDPAVCTQALDLLVRRNYAGAHGSRIVVALAAHNSFNFIRSCRFFWRCSGFEKKQIFYPPCRPCTV